jgi:antitoxin YefM
LIFKGVFALRMIFVYLYHKCTFLGFMLIISSREFRDNQKKYLDLVDEKKQQVIVQRGKNKSYKIVPISEEDLYFNSSFLKKFDESIRQMKKGETKEIKKEEIKKFLEIED